MNSLTRAQLRRKLIDSAPNSSPVLRRNRADRTLACLDFIVGEMVDNRHLLAHFDRKTVAEHTRRLTVIGLAPLRNAEDLVALAEPLGVDSTDTAALVRLVWVVNRRNYQTLARALRAHEGMVVGAALLLNDHGHLAAIVEEEAA